MGDTIVALPCFHAVRKAYPSADITLLTNFPFPKAAPMFELLVLSRVLIMQLAIMWDLGIH